MRATGRPSSASWGQVSAAHCTAALSSLVVCCRLLQSGYDACISRLHLVLYWAGCTAQVLQAAAGQLCCLQLRCALGAVQVNCAAPLKYCQLLQGGSDVCTRTALKRINWASYKINQSTDKVGVFVCICSTRIPYKGAGKEYIGEDLPSTSRVLCLNHCAACVQKTPTSRQTLHCLAGVTL